MKLAEVERAYKINLRSPVIASLSKAIYDGPEAEEVVMIHGVKSDRLYRIDGRDVTFFSMTGSLIFVSIFKRWISKELYFVALSTITYAGPELIVVFFYDDGKQVIEVHPLSEQVSEVMHTLSIVAALDS